MMSSNFSIENLIPLFTIGAILITAIYHTILFFVSKLKLVGRYSLYLWAALCYLVFAITIVPEKTFKSPSLPYLINSGIFLLSLLLYLNFLLLILNWAKNQETRIYKIIKKTYLITPLYFILRFPYFFFPPQYVETIKACGFILDAYLFLIFIYLIYLIVTNKKRDYNRPIVTGSVLMIFFNLFTSFTYYTQGYLLGLSHVSFIALGYFCDIIFFSLVVSLQMRQNIKDKYLAIEKMGKKELELERERKKASDILITHDFEIQNERAKAIIEQRTIIGRKLHDDLSGSLVALKYLARDFKTKTANVKEKERFNNLEAEISSIYKDTRRYSHELSANAAIAETEISYDILAYLKKLTDQFSKIGLLDIHTSINTAELYKLNAIQTKHIYFILKECITNTIKHTTAKKIYIDIIFNNNECIIRFLDDGKGFDSSKTEGQGIKGIRNRVEALFGFLEIKIDSNGTTFIITFNIKKSRIF